jgi:hypothetical protein
MQRPTKIEKTAAKKKTAQCCIDTANPTVENLLKNPLDRG